MTTAQVNILLLAMGALQGMLFIILLFKKRSKERGYLFIAAYLLVMIVQIVMKVAGKTWLLQTIRPLYIISYQLPFLYGPLIYLYVTHTISQRAPEARSVLHFTPFILVLGTYIFGNPNHAIPWLLVPLFHIKWSMILQLLSLTAYHTLAFSFLEKYGRKPIVNNYLTDKSKTRWLKQLIFNSWLVCSLVSVVICFLYYWFPRHQEMRFGFVSLTFFLYWISYKVWSQPELFSIVRGNSRENKEWMPVPRLTAHLPAKKYSNSGLQEENMNRIVSAVEQNMHTRKLFLNPELTIDDVAEAIGCSRHHLSQALNDNLRKSFYEYINDYRVEEAKQLLIDPSRSDHKIAAIAYDAGFNSLSTFNDVFKKTAGLTPSGYRRQGEKKKLERQRV